MNHTLVVVLGFSIIVPAIVGLFRINKVEPIYLPFLICTWVGFLNEFLSYLLINVFYVSNSINSDIYCLIEALLYVWLFNNFNLFSNRKHYILLTTILGVAWLFDNLILSKITRFDSYFMIMYSLIIVLMSVTIINKLITSQANLFMNPIFLLCTAFIIYFFVSAVVEIFWLYGLNASKIFRLQVYRIMAFINLSINLIFALAILWMHRKQEFIPQQ